MGFVGCSARIGSSYLQGVTKSRKELLATLEQEQAKLTALSRQVFRQLSEERLAYANEQQEAMCQAHPAYQCFLTIPGIGPLTATAPGGRGQRCDALHERPSVCRIAGARTMPAFYRWQAAPARDQHTRGDVSASTPRARCQGHASLEQAQE